MGTRLVLCACAALLVGTTAGRAAPTPDAVAAAGRGVAQVVKTLASGTLLGRDNDTRESLRAQVYLWKRLRRLGPGLVGGGTDLDSYRQRFERTGQRGTNLLAVIRGRELPDEYVMVGAHYDHLGTRSGDAGACSTALPPGGYVCNGATDNAAGVAVVMGVARALHRLSTPPRRSVVVALWDAEEDGLVGSAAYVAAPVVPLAATRAYVNFDIQGSDLLPAAADQTFAISAETGGGTLQGMVAAAAEPGLVVRQLSFIFGQLRSDYANFVAASVPTVFFSDATNGCYHTVLDDPAIVDWTKLGAEARTAFRLTLALAEAPALPAFVAPPAGLATYADAVALAALFHAAEPDLPRFAPADRATLVALRDALDRIVADGPGAFDPSDAGVMLAGAVDSLDAIARLGCLRPPR